MSREYCTIVYGVLGLTLPVTTCLHVSLALIVFTDSRFIGSVSLCLSVCLSVTALIVFTDGRYIGSVLDRNGLRPSRYYVSRDNFMYMASEVGVANVPANEVTVKGRLKPGRLLLVDTRRGVFVRDDVIKEQIAMMRPVASWIEQEV